MGKADLKGSFRVGSQGNPSRVSGMVWRQIISRHQLWKDMGPEYSRLSIPNSCYGKKHTWDSKMTEVLRERQIQDKGREMGNSWDKWAFRP